MARIFVTTWLWIATIAAMRVTHRYGGCGMHILHLHQSPERDPDHAHHQAGERSPS